MFSDFCVNIHSFMWIVAEDMRTVFFLLSHGEWVWRPLLQISCMEKAWSLLPDPG